MTLKFDRKVTITFGPRGESLREVKDLRVRFKISKSTKAKANSAVIEIWNLSEDSRNVLKADDPIINVVAGYEGLQKGIWFGDVAKVTNLRQSVDRITKIESGDGEVDLADSTFSKSYAKGTSLQNVVRDVIGSFPNLSFSQVLDTAIDGTKQLVTGGTFEGSSQGILQELLAGVGLSFSVQDGEIRVAGDSSLASTEQVVASINSGLIETPAQTKTGVAFRMLLEPRIRPGTIIRLESENLSGVYVAQDVTHDGDNWAQNWYTNVEAIPNE